MSYERVLISQRFNATTSDIKFNPELGSQATLAQTTMALHYPIGSGENNVAYMASNFAAAGHIFLAIDHNSGSPRLFGGFNSTGTANRPSNSAFTGLTYGVWQYSACVYAGGLASSGISFYQAKDGEVMGNVGQTGGIDGTTAVLAGAGNFHIGNRDDEARTCNGDLAWLARWNRTLGFDELLQAQKYGPLSVKDGMILCWANDKDYGPYKLNPIYRQNIGSGRTPRYVPLTLEKRRNWYYAQAAAATAMLRHPGMEGMLGNFHPGMDGGCNA